MSSDPSPVDAYIAAFPPAIRERLEAVRTIVREVAPAAGETVSYGIAAFTLEGRSLVYLAGWQRHLSVYPVPGGDASLEADLAPYRAGRGTLRFASDEALPLDLIRRAVTALAERRTRPR